jgi:hypothetical protein
MAQVSQIQASQRQGEVAQQQQQLNKMKIEELIADRQELNDFALKLKDTGITPRKYMEMLRSSRDPVKQEKGMEGLMRLDEIEKFDAYLARQAKPAGVTMPTGAPSMMRQPAVAPAAPTQDMLGTGMYGMAPTAPMNALAANAGVSPQPSVNALASPQSRLDDLEARFREVSRFSRAPGAKAEADRLKDQIKALQAVHVVPNVGLVSGAGQTIVASGMAPTEIKKLTSERDSLPAGDPRRKVYDQAIADLGAANRNAEARLKFDQNKFAFEKANPTMSIQQTPTGYVAINTQNGMAIPVLYGQAGFQATGGAQPAAASAASMMRQPPAALPGQRTPAIPGMASVLDQTGAPTAPAAMPMPSTTGERVPGQPVTAKKALPEAYAKQAMGVANTNDSLEKLLSTMKNFKSSDMLNPTRRAELGQAHATTLLFAKELFNLGVLNGGDERIVNSVINNPVDFSSTAVPIEAIRKQARDLQGVVDRTNKNLSTVYKMPLLKLDRSTPSEVANDIHSQAEAILRGTPPRGNQ